MMLAALREEVLEANLELARRGLAADTFGNASGVSREKGLIVIKPSGGGVREPPSEGLGSDRHDGKVVEVPCGRPRIGDTRDFVQKIYQDWRDCAHSLEVRNDLGASLGAKFPAWARRTRTTFAGPVPVTDI